jgi:hypothetical protein
VPAERVVGARSSTDFGVNGGAGVNVRLGRSSSLFVEARYHYVWGPEADAAGIEPARSGSTNGNNEFFPLVIGFRF